MNIIFATFSPWEKGNRSPTNGIVEPMVSFFVPRCKSFVLIDQPHPGSDRLIPIVEIYEKGKLKRTTHSSLFVSWLYPVLKLHNTLQTSITFKIRDFLSVLDFVLRDGRHCDFFIGLESVNTLAAILLKKFGLVEKVVYYVTDFTPKRYSNAFLNKLYLSLDKLAFEYSDIVWDVSKELMTARMATGFKPDSKKQPLHVPIALFPSQISSIKIKSLPQSIVYAGELKKENGPDLAIKSFKQVLKKVPLAKLHIFTNGHDSETQSLRDLTDELGIHSKVFFHGLIQSQTELINDLKQFSIGLAPYKALPDSPRWWADATKIRLYLAAGLPVITTQVPPIGKQLMEEGSGLVVKDSASEISKAIISLLKDKALYKKMKQNAIISARNNTWDKVYSKTLKNMGVTLDKL